jgi:hypothetical protein
MDTGTNSVITIVYNRHVDHMINDIGFTIKDTASSLPGGISRIMIVPIVKKIGTSSEAAASGLRIGMRIIGVGTTTIHPCRLMPSSMSDYSPARHCTRMIIDTIKSSMTVKLRVDT